MSPEELAAACADRMWAQDDASQALGMKILDVQPGSARLEMLVRGNMLNGHRTCHGGYIFTLADSAFAFACNTYNQNTVAQGCKIDFVAPAFGGDLLTAEAEERYREGRSGIYDVTVTNQDGTVIAEMRGNSRTVKGQHVPELEEKT